MVKVRVVSLMWGTAYERYGKIFVETFNKHWPNDVELYIVTDRELPVPRAMQVILGNCIAYAGFMKKWGTDRVANGFDRHKSEKLDADGRSWRHDAVKWMPQGIAPNLCLKGLDDGDIFVWLDADVETHTNVPKKWPQELLDGHDVAALFRDGTHTEIGCYLLKMGPDTRGMLNKFSRLYQSGDVFALKETHSAFVWDHALSQYPDLKKVSLSRGDRGHVWPSSPLGQYTVHKKGKRKPQ